ncbi:MAG: 4Fe-4S cluster-binding domain-containing protein [Candidatus Njordarchaeia archaeon]
MPNEKYDWFARSPSSAIRPFELNNEGRGQALVLRFAGCNLRCPLCYAWRYAWFMHKNGYRYNINTSIQALSNLPKLLKKKIVWVRIQGGEPCLTFDRILYTITFAVHALNIIHTYNLNYYSKTRAVIQTNAITFSTLSNAQINQICSHLRNSLNSLSKGKLVFEVSFKSPMDPSYLRSQILGYERLLNDITLPLLKIGFDNVAIYPVAGLGPSIDFHNTYIIPIEPLKLPEEIPLFHPITWSQQFRQVVNDFLNNVVPNYSSYSEFRRNPRTNNGKKIAIEELEPTQFQTSWISGYASRYSQFKVSVPPLSNLLRKLSDDPNPQWFALFRRYNQWLQVLNQIPVAMNANNLLSIVQQMNNYFYPSHPIGHYPYL